MCSLLNNFTIRNVFKINKYLLKLCDTEKNVVVLKHTLISNSSNHLDTENPDKSKTKPKTIRIPQITLYLADNSKVVTTLENATKLAKRRSLQLVKESDFDKIKETPIYRLIPNSKYIKELSDLDEVNESKVKITKEKKRKIVNISGSSADHDIQIKINNINKILVRKHNVKLVIQSEIEKANTIIKVLKEKIEQIGNIKTTNAKKGSTILLIDSKDSADNKNLTENLKD